MPHEYQGVVKSSAGANQAKNALEQEKSAPSFVWSSIVGNDLPSESIKATAPLSPYKLASHPIQLDATDGIYAE